MKGVIQFAKGITFEKLNPLNLALKNDYINNLFYTGFNSIPKFNEVFDGVRVIRSFVSNAYASANCKSMLKEKYGYKYTEGLAVMLTWDKFHPVDDIVKCLDVMTRLPNDAVVLFHVDDKCVQVLFGNVGPKQLIEVSSTTGEHLIYSS